MIFLICLLTLFRITTSLSIDCNYDDRFFWVSGTIYSCELGNTIKILSEEIIINHATGQHKDSKGNKDVLGLKIENANIQFFPKGLENIFNDLKLIWIEKCNLKEIHQYELTLYSNLEYLFLGHNDIEILEEDLFKFHPNMKAISFWNCKIFHIHPNVFDNLLSLKELWLPKNGCIDMKTNPNSVSAVIGEVKAKCQSPAYLKLKAEFDKLNQQAEELTSEVKIINESCDI